LTSENRERARGAESSFSFVLDPRACYRALKTRDERFDGRFFVAVTSTGIYCRPICPARPPKPEHCRFYPSAAAAQEAGFRPCLRCRPETAPDRGSWRGTSNTVSRGLALIAEGELDGDDASVDALAERLGVGGRQLRRLFQQHLGASPIAVAQTRRVLLAKQLIVDTRLPMSEIALAAGFGSVRRFNEIFQGLFERPPSALRPKSAAAVAEGTVAGSGVAVRLRYRPPYDWESMVGYLRARAIDGVERVETAGRADAAVYARTLRLDAPGAGGSRATLATVVVRHLPRLSGLEATVRCAHVRLLPQAVARVRHAFDLGADVATIGAHLARDPLLAPLVAARPGLRAPGAWDGFELGVRAILGQQVSVEAGRRLASRLVALCGTVLQGADRGLLPTPALTHAFPTAQQVTQADLSGLGVPRARREALVALARAAIADGSLFEPLDDVDATVARLRAVRGVGEWTAHYIALRAARETDAFPAADAVLLRSAVARGGLRAGAAGAPSLLLRAEQWRPWRAYAAQHIWTAAADRGGARTRDEREKDEEVDHG
jgi:AraC family transcriptional regulator of adaptative response / DNA-3-methyladenine glycosylase II